MGKLLNVIFILGLFGTQTLQAQNSPVFSHFYANPFQFNPSFIANHGYAEANLFYRKQWMGIENSPSTAALNVQAPFGRNVSLGFTAYNEKAILLSTNSALATFGYRVRLGHEHHVNFGLSAGMGFNNFNFAALENTTDPALQNIVQNNGFLNGQFGINYQRKNFAIGFALPKIFQSHPNTAESFNAIKFDEFKSKFGSASYTFRMKDVSIMPLAIYRALDTNQDQWEGAVVATFKSLFWVGASYRTEYGLTGMIGVNIKGKLRLGYAYEHPTGDIAQVANGSHEIYMGARVGKRNREEEIVAKEKHDAALAAKHEKDKEHAEALAMEKELKEKERIAAERAASIKKDTAHHESVIVAPIVEQKKEEEKITAPENNPPIKGEIKPENTPEKITADPGSAYYVVLGVFKHERNARRKIAIIKNKGMQPSIFFEELRGLHFVHTFSSPTKEEAMVELNKVRQNPKFADAWIYFK